MEKTKDEQEVLSSQEHLTMQINVWPLQIKVTVSGLKNTIHMIKLLLK